MNRKPDIAHIAARVAAPVQPDEFRHPGERQNWQSIGLEQFSARVYQEGKQLEQGLLKQGMRPEDADQAVRQQMKQRYGIDL